MQQRARLAAPDENTVCPQLFEPCELYTLHCDGVSHPRHEYDDANIGVCPRTKLA